MLDQPVSLFSIALLLSLVPVLFAVATAYLKVNVVMLLLRNAIGAQQVPSGMIVMVLSMSLTLMIMQPVFSSAFTRLENVSSEEIKKADLKTIVAIVKDVSKPWQDFVRKHAGESEVATLRQISESAHQQDSIPSLAESEILEDNSIRESESLQLTEKRSDFPLVLLGFLLTELKEAFFMGFVVMLPFLIIDFVIANLLAGVGMYMFSPVLIALPIKILMIVAFDFWSLLFRGLYLSYV